MEYEKNLCLCTIMLMKYVCILHIVTSMGHFLTPYMQLCLIHDKIHPYLTIIRQQWSAIKYKKYYQKYVFDKLSIYSKPKPILNIKKIYIKVLQNMSQ
jgi:hypothetical protein